jgi:hypothetical protein
LGITGTLSSSYIKVPTLFGSNYTNGFEVECTVQLPWVSSSYSSSLLQGNLWQFNNATSTPSSGSFSLYWTKDALNTDTGYIVLSGSDGKVFSSSNLTLFDGKFLYLAAGLKGNNFPTITVQRLNNTYIDYSGTFTGTVAFSGVFTGSNYDFIMGASSRFKSNIYSR